MLAFVGIALPFGAGCHEVIFQRVLGQRYLGVLNVCTIACACSFTLLGVRGVLSFLHFFVSLVVVDGVS